MSEVGEIHGEVADMVATIGGNMTLEGMVTVGPETAARLGVAVGTQVSLGVLASTDAKAEPGYVHEMAYLLRGVQ